MFAHTAPSTRPLRRDLRAGIWRLGDPKISLASMASIFLGGCAAARDGAIAWGWLACTVLGIFCIEVAKNASGELFDFHSGADQAVAPEDRSPFSGGKRVLVEGLLTRRQTMIIASVGYALGAASGLAIALWREPGILWIGLTGMACSYFYNAPPLRLSYRGFGEAAVALCYGPLIGAGTYLVQRGRVTADAVLVSIPLGLLIGAFLWINEFPDRRADLGAGKRNLVVRLGGRRASLVFAGLIGSAGVAVGMLPLAGLPEGVWLGGLALGPGTAAARILVVHHRTTARVIPAQALTLAAFLLLSVGSGIGLILDR